MERQGVFKIAKLGAVSGNAVYIGAGGSTTARTNWAASNQTPDRLQRLDTWIDGKPFLRRVSATAAASALEEKVYRTAAF